MKTQMALERKKEIGEEKRKRIVRTLRNYPYSSSFDLAKRLRLSANSIRKHLKILENNREIECLYQIKENRVRFTYYIPEHKTSTRLCIPSDAVELLKWEPEDKLHFYPSHRNSIVIRKDISPRKEQTALFRLDAFLQMEDDHYYIRLPINLFSFFQINVVSLREEQFVIQDNALHLDLEDSPNELVVLSPPIKPET